MSAPLRKVTHSRRHVEIAKRGNRLNGWAKMTSTYVKDLTKVRFGLLANWEWIQ